MIVHVAQKWPQVALYQVGLYPLEVAGYVAHGTQHTPHFDQAALGLKNTLQRERRWLLENRVLDAVDRLIKPVEGRRVGVHDAIQDFVEELIGSRRSVGGANLVEVR